MIEAEKKTLRRQAAERRAELFGRAGAAGGALRDLFLRHIALPGKNAAVSGFWPMGEEIDTRPLLLALDAMGYRCCLPAVVGKGKPLAFRRWTPATRLEPGGFGVSVPPADAPEAAPELVPELVIVPLLAFDRRGWRLGYGAGFYDLTLRALRRAGHAKLAVGVGFAGQEVASVPHDERDEKLDWIVTEREAFKTAEG
ncbi:MAG: 5-formyltetrahydrofolate cyclo-ligase [Rhodospirillales bacterium]